MKGFGLICSGLLTERDARALRVAVFWIVFAAICFAAGTILMSEGLIPIRTAGTALATITALASLIAIRSYLSFLRGADELLRKVQLEGLALGFGAGAAFTISYRLFERLGAPKLDTAGPFLVMIVFWAIGQWLGIRRYASETSDE